MKKWRQVICIGIAVCFLVAGCTKKEETRKPTPKKEETVKKVSISMSGDILIEDPVYAWMGDTYDFGTYFDKVKPYLKGDLVIGNQEVPLGGKELGLAGIDYRFNGPEEVAKQLPDVGFHVLTFSNNHSYDHGMKGIRNTNANLRKYGIETTGSFANKEEREKPLVVERNGVKIAILAYTYDTNQYIDENNAYAVNKFLNANHEFDEEHQKLLKHDVELAKQEADAVIVAMHWGTEFTYELSETQKEAAQFLNHLGVDIIIGNHPHTLQGVETLKSKDGYETFVMYSLGNFVSGAANVDRASEQFTNMYEIGGIVNLDLYYDTKTHKVSLKNKVMTPIVNHFTDGYQNFQLIPFSSYNEELASVHDQRAYSNDFTYDYLNTQLKSLFDGTIDWK